MRHEQDLKSLAFEFFETFAKLEFALKLSGYLTVDRNNVPWTNWAAFSDELEEFFTTESSPKFRNAKLYLLKNQPKREQVDSNGKIFFQEDKSDLNNLPSESEKNRKLFDLVKIVRNNLFHGGKFNGEIISPGRNREVILSSLHILNGCIQAETENKKLQMVIERYNSSFLK